MKNTMASSNLCGISKLHQAMLECSEAEMHVV
jgi:hypothetical protein